MFYTNSEATVRREESVRPELDMEVSKKAKIMNQYNQVPRLAQDTTLESDKNTRKHHIQESQEISLFLAGDHKAGCMTNTKHK